MYTWNGLIPSQQPRYPSLKRLHGVVNTLKQKEGLVSFKDIERLKKNLASSSCVVQIGDCAESFSHIPNYVENYCNLFKNIFKKIPDDGIVVGRIAGQYAKSRTMHALSKNHKNICPFFGESVNDVDPKNRIPNPSRMLEAYNKSLSTLSSCNQYMHNEKKRFFSSHELCLLPYEEGLLRAHDGVIYDSSAHFLWIGARTREKNAAHVQFASHIYNPIGIKIDAHASIEELENLIKILNPTHQKGRLSFIIRMGKECIQKKFPLLLNAFWGHPITWICDPCHGNTTVSSSRLKQRIFSDIVEETCSFFRIVKAFNIKNCGIHLEASGFSTIAECIDPSRGINESSASRFMSLCDPRLSASQALELVDIMQNFI